MSEGQEEDKTRIAGKNYVFLCITPILVWE